MTDVMDYSFDYFYEVKKKKKQNRDKKKKLEKMFFPKILDDEEIHNKKDFTEK